MLEVMDIKTTIIMLIIFLMTIIPFSMISSSRHKIINNKVEQILAAQNRYSSNMQGYLMHNDNKYVKYSKKDNIDK